MPLNLYIKNERDAIRFASLLGCRAIKNKNDTQRSLSDIFSNNSILSNRFDILATKIMNNNNKAILLQFTRALDFIDNKVKTISQNPNTEIKNELLDLICLPIENHFNE